MQLVAFPSGEALLPPQAPDSILRGPVARSSLPSSLPGVPIHTRGLSPGAESALPLPAPLIATGSCRAEILRQPIPGTSNHLELRKSLPLLPHFSHLQKHIVAGRVAVPLY